MAYVPGNGEEEDKNQPGESYTGEKVLSSGGTAGAAPGTPSQAPAQQQKGSGFVNLNKYIQANVPGADRMAGQLTSKIDEDVGSARSAIDTYQGNVAKAADASSKIGQISDVSRGFRQGGGGVTADAYKSAIESTYAGPKLDEVEGFQERNQAARTAQTGIQAGQDAGARQAYIQDRLASNKNRYSTGMGLLDTFLTGTGQAGAKVAEAGQKYKGFDTELDSSNRRAAQTVDQQAAQHAQALQRLQQDRDAALSQARGSIKSAEAAAERTNLANQAADAQLLKALQAENPNIRRQAFRSAGIDEAVGEALYKAGGPEAMSQLLGEGTKAGTGAFLSDTQRANFANLASILGPEAGFAGEFDVTGGKRGGVDTSKAEQAKQYFDTRSSLDQAVEAENARRAQQWTEFTDSNVTDSELQTLGIDRAQWNQLQDAGYTMEDFVGGPSKATYGDVANADQSASLEELAQLFGLDTGLAPASAGGMTTKEDAVKAALDAILKAQDDEAQAQKDTHRPSKTAQNMADFAGLFDI